MSYRKIKSEVERLVGMELNMASEQCGEKFNSAHEAYAVILEEHQELLAEIYSLCHFVKKTWECVKCDEDISECLTEIEKRAIYAASEAIQVAAMARKAMR